MARQCIICNIDIPEGRLKILPPTKTCVNHSSTEPYTARRTSTGTSADDLDTGIEIFKDPEIARRVDELDKERYT